MHSWLLLALIPLVLSCTTPLPQPAPLTKAQKRAFLHYYSPLILKQAHESGPAGLHPGADWITNFHFDHDGGQFANNRQNWTNGLTDFVQDPTAHIDWQIRPTLYSHVIEFSEPGQPKSAVLVYHVYHAMQQGSVTEVAKNSIHDWERIEVRLDRLGSVPGQGEEVRFVVITHHSEHTARRGGTPGPWPWSAPRVQWYETPSGSHPMIWQSRSTTDPDPLDTITSPDPQAAHIMNELHFVDESAQALIARLEQGQPARVRIPLHPEPVTFHYVFVGEGDPTAVSFWNAQEITKCSAATLTSGKRPSEAVGPGQLKRIRFELQDTADMLPTYLVENSNGSWDPDPQKVVEIEIGTAVANEAGTSVEIEAQMQKFLYKALDVTEQEEDRNGHPRKHWFWGVYHFDREGKFYSDALDSQDRVDANGCSDCVGRYWLQSDYFAHDGRRASCWPFSGTERGRWLRAGWATAARGGSDGRWQQLFVDDRDLSCQ